MDIDKERLTEAARRAAWDGYAGECGKDCRWPCDSSCICRAVSDDIGDRVLKAVHEAFSTRHYQRVNELLDANTELVLRNREDVSRLGERIHELQMQIKNPGSSEVRRG